MCRFTETIEREEIRKSRRKYWIVKRGQDIFFSALALIILFPMMLFKFYKFRTMRVGAEHDLTYLLKKNEADGPVFKIRNDSRLTHVGRVLRRISLDELPQL